MTYEVFHARCIVVGAKNGIPENAIRFSDEGTYYVAVFPGNIKLVANAIAPSIRLYGPTGGRVLARI